LVKKGDAAYNGDFIGQIVYQRRNTIVSTAFLTTLNGRNMI